MGSRIQASSERNTRGRKARELASKVADREAERIVMEGLREKAAKEKRHLADLDQMQQGSTNEKGLLWKWRENFGLNAPAYLSGKKPASSGQMAPSRQRAPSGKETDDLIAKTTALREKSDR